MNFTSWSREEISIYLPHKGTMMLIDKIESFTENEIIAKSINHLDINHPLLKENRLGLAIGIEYAAQASAIHSRINAEVNIQNIDKHLPNVQTSLAPIIPGKLVSVREINCFSKYLNIPKTSLIISAKQEQVSAQALIYSFLVANENQKLISGRLMIHLG